MESKQKVVAIIPARGGSRRIPKKNIIDFAGKPLIAWTIEAALASKLFDKVIVSTDTEEIAAVSRAYGAEVPFLRDHYADDHSPVSEATLRTIAQLEENGEQFDIVVQLFAVCPLRTAADMEEAYRFFLDKKVDFLLSCFQYVGMNPWWAVQLNEEQQPQWVFDNVMKRSQDLPTLFCPTGAIWIANVDALKRDKTFYGEKYIFWEINWKHALDIDTFEDLEMGLALKGLPA
jgi:N-acylneuraminate cytidylyltransferase